MLNRLKRGTAVFPMLLIIAGCGASETPPGSAATEDATESPVAAADMPVGTTAEFKWYLERSTPAGQSTITRTGDGRITNESFLHWNNREYDVDSVLQLDAAGAGEWPLDLSGESPGTTEYFQVWFRDPAHPGGSGVGRVDRGMRSCDKQAPLVAQSLQSL